MKPNSPQNLETTRVAVLDAGGQYVDLVRKAVERQGIPADVLPLNTPRTELEAKYAAIIISGSPASSHEQAAPTPAADIWQTELPLLGICYGMQSMVVMNGGTVIKNAIREDGRVTTQVNTAQPIFKGIKKDFVGLFTHGDFVKTVPDGFTAIGSHKLSDGFTAYSAIANGNKIGVQFHPEVFDDTPEGYQLFKNFLFGIAGLQPDQVFLDKRLAEIISSKQAEIVAATGDKHVIAFISGGVDSSVAATLAAKVIAPEKFHGFYIDSGFMRDEDDLVIDALQAAGIQVEKVEAAADFEQATISIDGTESLPLSQVTDPEEKRKIIGKTFIDLQSRLIQELDLTEALLLQGTNAADRIESGHSKSDTNTMTIKTHHNQVPEVQVLKEKGLLLEPLDDLFKDEVRALGDELGLPKELVQRQPFPGPGLAIRILTIAEDQTELPVAAEQNDVQTYVDEAFKDLHLTAQLLPIRSVGVGGDERSHVSVLALQGPTLSGEQLAALGRDVPAHFRGVINRVIYALGDASLINGSVTKTLLDADARSQLRQADKIVFEAMRAANLLDNIKQFPVILLPLSFGRSAERSIVLRPVTTSTFMTVQAMLPERDLPNDFLKTIAQRILAEVPGVSQVFLDLTNKPPATTEWE